METKIEKVSYGFLVRIGVYSGHSMEFQEKHWNHDVLVKSWVDKNGVSCLDIIDPYFSSFRTRSREIEYNKAG